MSKYLDLRNYVDNLKIEEAAQIIKNGGIVVFPTETVYGIGANGLNSQAIEKVYIAKGRKQDNPLILLVSNKEMLDRIHKEKIRMSDAIYVINKDGYIGESTKQEIEFAKEFGKEVLYMY